VAIKLSDGDYEIEARIVRETNGAMLIDDGRREVWLPKRFVSVMMLSAEIALIRMRGWVAREKGYA
jgi:RNase P/RNase MRP subunit p29